MSEAAQHPFSAAERDAVYRAIALRHDCRDFRPSQVLPDEQLQRLLEALHQAPSVGMMQPWCILRIPLGELLMDEPWFDGEDADGN